MSDPGAASVGRCDRERGQGRRGPACRYPDGVRVLCATVLDLRDGRIVRQSCVQDRDE